MTIVLTCDCFLCETSLLFLSCNYQFREVTYVGLISDSDVYLRILSLSINWSNVLDTLCTPKPSSLFIKKDCYISPTCRPFNLKFIPELVAQKKKVGCWNLGKKQTKVWLRLLKWAMSFLIMILKKIILTSMKVPHIYLHAHYQVV